jgi:hypothetical protein
MAVIASFPKQSGGEMKQTRNAIAIAVALL